LAEPRHGPGLRLTPREREVLEHAALGMSNRQIGDALEIAEQTVKNHLGNVMRKLSLHDRTHAVVFAIGEGLIPMPTRDDYPNSVAPRSRSVRNRH
jgi:DNA-binding NarL/FixJ family response regulator